jgi:DNA replication protein DnaC
MDDPMQKLNLNDLPASIRSSISADHTDISSAANATTTSREEPDDAATAAPQCPRCEDVGYYLLDVPVHHPQFGKLMPCDCRQEYKHNREYVERYRLSNMRAFTEKTFDTFDPSVPGVRDAYRFAQEYASRRPFEGWLVFFGTYGSGKTHLAAAIANVALHRNYSVIFTVVPDLLDHLRSTFGPTSDIAYDERFETIREIPVLVLDDLGTEDTLGPRKALSTHQSSLQLSAPDHHYNQPQARRYRPAHLVADV